MTGARVTCARAASALAFATLAAACAAPPAALPPPRASADPRVSVVEGSSVFAGVPVLTREGGLLRLSVRLENPLPTDARIVQTTDWFEASGQPIRSLLSSPQQLTVPAHGDAIIERVAPRSDAADFRMRVEPDPTSYAPNPL